MGHRRSALVRHRDRRPRAIRFASTPDGGPFGGVPATTRPDPGLEFAAGVLVQACGFLAIRLSPTPGYSPDLKGKVERL